MQQMICPICKQLFDLVRVTMNTDGCYTVHKACGALLELQEDESAVQNYRIIGAVCGSNPLHEECDDLLQQYRQFFEECTSANTK